MIIRSGSTIGGKKVLTQGNQIIDTISFTKKQNLNSLKIGNVTLSQYVPAGSVKLQSTNGFLAIGSTNSSWTHIITDRGSFYFDKQILVSGGVITSYDEDLILQRNDVNYIRVTNNGIHEFYKDLEIGYPNALVFSYASLTNIDHIWYDDSTNAFYFSADTTKRGSISARIEANNITLNGETRLPSGVGNINGVQFQEEETISPASITTKKYKLNGIDFYGYSGYRNIYWKNNYFFTYSNNYTWGLGYIDDTNDEIILKKTLSVNSSAKYPTMLIFSDQYISPLFTILTDRSSWSIGLHSYDESSNTFSVFPGTVFSTAAYAINYALNTTIDNLGYIVDEGNTILSIRTIELDPTDKQFTIGSITTLSSYDTSYSSYIAGRVLNPGEDIETILIFTYKTGNYQFTVVEYDTISKIFSEQGSYTIDATSLDPRQSSQYATNIVVIEKNIFMVEHTAVSPLNSDERGLLHIFEYLGGSSFSYLTSISPHDELDEGYNQSLAKDNISNEFYSERSVGGYLTTYIEKRQINFRKSMKTYDTKNTISFPEGVSVGKWSFIKDEHENSLRLAYNKEAL